MTEPKITVLGRDHIDLLTFKSEKRNCLQYREAGPKLLCKFLKDANQSPKFQEICAQHSPLFSVVDLRNVDNKYKVHSQQFFDTPQALSLSISGENVLETVSDNSDVLSSILVIEDPKGDLLSANGELPQLEDGCFVFYKTRCLGDPSWKPAEDSTLIRKVNELVVIIDADDLRVKQTPPPSWEQAAADSLEYFKECQPVSCMLKLTRIKWIIRFGYVGAIVVLGEARHLYFDPQTEETGFTRLQSVPSSALEAAFLSGLISSKVDRSPNNEDLQTSIQNGLRKARYLADTGFILENNVMTYPELLPDKGKEVLLKCSEIATKDLEKWSIFKDMVYPTERPEEGERNILNYCQTIVCKGVEEAGLHVVPIARFGRLVTTDRWEIQAYHEIAYEVEDYLNKPQDKPLSIGVFGAPGSGKSFGIKEIIQTITQKISTKQAEKYPVLEYNVSQFLSYSDLLVALQTVRDHTVSGRVPVVCFDEFDTTLNGELGWLKYFLAPMQDGKFSEQGYSRPIGQAILVFIGGTASTFKEFQDDTIQIIPAGTTNPTVDFPPKQMAPSTPSSSGDSPRESQSRRNSYKDVEDAKAKKAARTVKKPDFISRLQHHLDVKGYEKADGGDLSYMLRRAFFIRSKLEDESKNRGEKLPDEVVVDTSLLHSLLKVAKFKHGARSIEAIIRGSKEGKLDRSTLPPKHELDSHLENVAEFLSVLDKAPNPRRT